MKWPLYTIKSAEILKRLAEVFTVKGEDVSLSEQGTGQGEKLSLTPREDTPISRHHLVQLAIKSLDVCLQLRVVSAHNCPAA